MSEQLETFKRLSVPTGIYAFLYMLFLYNNMHSYTMLLFVISTIIYCKYCLKENGYAWKKSGNVFCAVLIALAISDFITTSSFILICNNVAIFGFVVLMMLDQLYDLSRWSLGNVGMAVMQYYEGSLKLGLAPIEDTKAYVKSRLEEEEGKSKGGFVLTGLLISIPVLLVLVPILASADAVFANQIYQLFDKSSMLQMLGRTLLLLFALGSSYSSLKFLFKKEIQKEEGDKKVHEPLIAITVLAIVTAVYVIFCSIQLVYLCGGHMELPEGYTYSEYAREGFFQLLFVGVINIAAVLVIFENFKESKVLKGLLTVVSVCTYVMLASAVMRLTIYTGTYGLTLLRVLAYWAIVLLGVLMAGVLIYIYKPGFGLARYFLVVTIVWFMVLSLAHVDYWITAYNYTYVADFEYSEWELETLSADAAWALKTYSPDSYVYCVEHRYSSNDWWHFNLAEYIVKS